MNKKLLMLGYVLGTVVVLLPIGLFATTVQDFGGEGIIKESSRIQDFIFGPPMRIAGVIGGAYGLVQAILSSSVKPLMVFVGIGLAVNIIPKFIDGVYGISGMMLP